jgi:hypothetical protein
VSGRFVEPVRGNADVVPDQLTEQLAVTMTTQRAVFCAAPAFESSATS